MTEAVMEENSKQINKKREVTGGVTEGLAI